MVKNNFISEFILSLLLIGMLIVFLNPFNLLMPPPFLTMLVVILIALFGAFSAFVWKEHVRDEREGFHRMLAGRIAFLVGTSILVVGIILQSWVHQIDPWLIYALAGMIIAKIAGLLYGQSKY